jgi:hypothetical protein
MLRARIAEALKDDDVELDALAEAAASVERGWGLAPDPTSLSAAITETKIRIVNKHAHDALLRPRDLGLKTYGDEGTKDDGKGYPMLRAAMANRGEDGSLGDIIAKVKAAARRARKSDSELKARLSAV